MKRIFRKEVKGMGILPATDCVFQKVQKKASHSLMGVSMQEMRGEPGFKWWQAGLGAAAMATSVLKPLGRK